jgi:hypothetical protein
VAIAGVVEHGNSAVLVTAGPGAVLDRRRIDLTHGLPTHPHRDAAAALGGDDVDALRQAMGRTARPPWQTKQQLAAAAAMAASAAR